MSEIISTKPNEAKILKCSTWHKMFNCQQANPGAFCSFLGNFVRKSTFTLLLLYLAFSEVSWRCIECLEPVSCSNSSFS